MFPATEKLKVDTHAAISRSINFMKFYFLKMTSVSWAAGICRVCIFVRALHFTPFTFCLFSLLCFALVCFQLHLFSYSSSSSTTILFLQNKNAYSSFSPLYLFKFSSSNLQYNNNSGCVYPFYHYYNDCYSMLFNSLSCLLTVS